MENMTSMVEVRAAYKRYGPSAVVLNGLNMTVKRGTIYGLLGPSGCGKTTLLSCIVGRKRLDAGKISLGVKEKADIGYMPQDISLFMDFTISEVFQFYGTLFDLSPRTIEQRTKDLSVFLELPGAKRFIKTLSGGQQRRVSFAVALFHDPQLLILDEPTVGVDPVLCHNIWQYLVKIAAVEKKTIIITTHYIEEARQSNTIGLMRQGVLLSESSPMELISSQNCSSLEDAFLSLSKKQADESNTSKFQAVSYPQQKKADLPFHKTENFVLSRFIAQLWKNFLWTKRNIPFLLFTLLLPALQAILFCETFGKDPEDLPVGLVSEEIRLATGTCHDLTYNSTYSPLLDCYVPSSFSCQFWKQLTTRMNITLYEDVEIAKSAAARNEVWGVMYINGNFTRAVEERISNGLHSDDLTVEQSMVFIWMDMSNYVIGTMLRRNIATSIIEFIKDILESCGVPREVGSLPIQVNQPIHGSREQIFAHSSAAAFICSFLFYFTMVFTSGAVKMESISGNLERSMVAGMTRMEIVCAHLIVQFCVMSMQIVLLMFVMYVIFSNPLEGDVYLTILILYIVATIGISYGFFLSEFFEEEKLISYTGIGTVMALFMINGGLWPIEGAHYFIKSACKLFPVVSAIDGYNSVTSRGYGIADNVVIVALVLSTIWIIIFSSLAHLFAVKKK